jgi:competence protein ComEC
VASFGIELMNDGAAFVAAQPHAVMTLSSAPQAALPIAFLGILFVCLWKGRGRWLGVPAALAVALWPRPDPPLGWISPNGAAAAVRRGDQAVLLRPDAQLFSAELWARRRGLALPEDPAAARTPLFACTGQSCRALYGEAPRISLWWTIRAPKPDALDALCRASDVLALKAEVTLPPSCGGVTVLAPSDFAKGGALEIEADGRFVWTEPLRGQRPWTRPA